MTNRRASAVSVFVETWAPEFVKSIAMFTGTTVGADATPAAGADETDTFIWHRQVCTRGQQGRVWIGVPMAQGLALAAGAADTPADQLALVREAIDQSVKAAAQVLNTGDCPGLQCTNDAGTDAPPAGIGGEVSWFKADAGVFGCAIRCDRDFEALLRPSTSLAPGASALVADDADPADQPAVFDRFVGVELPVSVVLGRATLRVRDVLKLAVGSLIELDTRTTDPVDVCVHGGVVARGEVVSIRGNYGVRILEVMSQRDRMNLEFKQRRHLPPADGPLRAQRVH